MKSAPPVPSPRRRDRKSTRLNSSHVKISYAVFCLKKKKKKKTKTNYIKIQKELSQVDLTVTALLPILALCVLSLTSYTLLIFFFFNDTATTEIYTLSLHDALPIFR